MQTIPEGTVLTPTQEEFANFSEYMEKLDKLYKPYTGIVKIIPPSNWKPRHTDNQPDYDKLIIKKPIQQNAKMVGTGYESIYIAHNAMSFNAYKQQAIQFDKITANLSNQEIQRKFWKTIAYSPPLYGSNIKKSFMDQQANQWNLRNLQSLLASSVKDKIYGITSPFIYIGTWKSYFSWHQENLNLSSINYLHEGKSKFWYGLQNDDYHILEKQAKINFPHHFHSCNQFMKHKNILINPYTLKKKYPNIRFHKIQQKQNQFIIIFGGAYHCGFNSGFNIAQSVNYATFDWLKQLPESKLCKCSKNPNITIQIVANNLRNSKIFSNLGKFKDSSQYKQFIKDNNIEQPKQQEQQVIEQKYSEHQQQIKAEINRIFQQQQQYQYERQSNNIQCDNENNSIRQSIDCKYFGQVFHEYPESQPIFLSCDIGLNQSHVQSINNILRNEDQSIQVLPQQQQQQIQYFSLQQQQYFASINNNIEIQIKQDFIQTNASQLNLCPKTSKFKKITKKNQPKNKVKVKILDDWKPKSKVRIRQGQKLLTRITTKFLQNEKQTKQ